MQPALISDRLASSEPVFSIEFFPPKTEKAAEHMLWTAERLAPYKPDFVSITYGAGGSTRERTLRYARKLKEDYGFNVMPHLTCVGHTRAELKETIAEIRAAELVQILALRGDPPKGEKQFKPHPEGFHYANQLVELIREVYPECTVGVAGYPEKHPEAPSLEDDLRNLKRKVDAGATFVTTQLFFRNEDYFNFVKQCRATGIDIPILPGLMSIASLDQAKRFCAMCGASIPAELEEKLARHGDDALAVEAAGVAWTVEQVKELLDAGVPGLHLYILNRAKPAMSLLDQLAAAGYHLGENGA